MVRAARAAHLGGNRGFKAGLTRAVLVDTPRKFPRILTRLDPGVERHSRVARGRLKTASYRSKVMEEAEPPRVVAVK